MNRLVCPLIVSLLAPGAIAQARHPRVAPASSEAPSGNPDELQPPPSAVPDADTLIQVIQSAAVAGNAEGARSISELLLRGVPPRAAAAGLDALGVLARPEGAPAVLRFLEHRRPMLRRHAIAAATAIHTPDLVAALVGRLADSDENVRVEAAVAVGEVGNARATPSLFRAFERDLETVSGPDGNRLLHESAKSIARIGSVDDVTRLLGYLRRAPFRSMVDAIRSALGRHDLPEPFKVRIVQRVGDLATREVRDFLTSVVADAHGQESSVARAARTAADRIAE
jgi:HEAT repeat protein